MHATKTKALPAVVGQWFTENTFAPDWLPDKLQQPAVPYIAAAAVQCVAIALTVGLVQLAPDFTFRGALILLGVIGVALTLGGGPGLLASLVGTVLLDFFLVPPTLSLSLDKGVNILNVIFYLIVCLATNLATAHAQRARQARPPG